MLVYHTKRTLSLVVSAVLALSLTACSKPTTEDGSGITTAISSQLPADNTSTSARDPVTVDGVTFRDENGNIILNSTHIKSVKTTKSDGENYAVLFAFTDEGAEILANATSQMIGQTMSLYINENLAFSAQLESSITNGEIMLSGISTKEEADFMSEDINARLNAMVEGNDIEKSAATPEKSQDIGSQDSIMPGDFPAGWNSLTGIVSFDDFTTAIIAVEPSYTVKENPLGFLGGTGLTVSGWCNGEVAVVPYQIDTLEPPLWGVAFGESGNVASAAIMMYSSAKRGIFWFDQESNTMSSPLACALWIACEKLPSASTLQERGAISEEVRGFIKSVSMMVKSSVFEPTESVPINTVDTTNTDVLLSKLQNLDFSDIAGTYYSEKYGSALITEDGTIMLDYYRPLGAANNPYTNVIFNSSDNSGRVDISKPENEGYIFCMVMNSNYYDSKINSEILLQDWLTIFPIGVPTVGSHYWFGSVIDCPDMDASEYRFVIIFSGESVTEDEVFIRQSAVTMEGAPDVDVLLYGFEVFRDIGFTSQQQDIIRTTTREFFLKNYPQIKSLSTGIGSISYGLNGEGITYCELASDTGETFRLKLDSSGSKFDVGVSTYDANGNILN